MNRRIGFWKWFGSKLRQIIFEIWNEFFGNQNAAHEKIAHIAGFTVWFGAIAFLLGIPFQSFLLIVAGPVMVALGLVTYGSTWIFGQYLQAVAIRKLGGEEIES